MCGQVHVSLSVVTETAKPIKFSRGNVGSAHRCFREKMALEWKFFSYNFLDFFLFLMTIFKVLLNLLQYCLFYVLVVWLGGMWDLSSITRDITCTPCLGKQSCNHWTTREIPLE